ncbi:Aste57867_17396 [Aphanomyces stellatus]|uniref:Amino acid transporter n=1 Tax=Aphanomyces stellatus TaxID=120398 RepID=A0A485L7T7_9STRA|nr:hypothetical protein As57867_017336 [Aphanomyces stellatus]VFT94152.1 Aste57867_17396 [Aphanomyces stellatus]
MDPSKPGVVLYEGSPSTFFNRFTMVDPGTPPPPSATALPSLAPPPPVQPRTNFMTHEGDDGETPYDGFSTPGLILGDSVSEKGGAAPARDHDFGPPPPPFQSIYVLFGAVVGLAIGAGLYFLKVDATYVQLIILPGTMFVRALRCLMVPLVFCVITIVVAETVAKGRTSILRWRTLLPYAVSSLLSTTIGTSLAIVFQTYFRPAAFQVTPTLVTPNPPMNLSMFCLGGGALAPSANGTLACLASALPFVAVNQTTSISVAGVVASAYSQLSLADQLVALANLLVPNNIFMSFANGSLLSTTIFALPVGVGIAYSETHDDHTLVLNLLRQLRNVFLIMLHRLLSFTAIGVAFLLAGAVSYFDTGNFSDVAFQMGTLYVAFVVAAVLHTLVGLPLYLYLRTRANPYSYMQAMAPAYIFAVGCASSLATLPVAIACIQRTNVSRALVHIAMPFGTTVNLNAAGLYFPLAVVFMANLAGLSDELTPTRYFMLFLGSLLGSMGTAPVPNAGLVYILTLWATCFPKTSLPPSFAWVVASDFVIDRICTAINVNGNAIVTRILAEEIDEAFDARAAQQQAT